MTISATIKPLNLLEHWYGSSDCFHLFTKIRVWSLLRQHGPVPQCFPAIIMPPLFIRKLHWENCFSPLYQGFKWHSLASHTKALALEPLQSINRLSHWYQDSVDWYRWHASRNQVLLFKCLCPKHLKTRSFELLSRKSLEIPIVMISIWKRKACIDKTIWGRMSRSQHWSTKDGYYFLKLFREEEESGWFHFVWEKPPVVF